MKRLLLALPLTVLLGTTAVLADSDRCVPSAGERQSEAALREKLAAEGWEVRRVKIEDGCYEVYAIDAAGRRVERYFDPVTLTMVGSDRDD